MVGDILLYAFLGLPLLRAIVVHHHRRRLDPHDLAVADHLHDLADAIMLGEANGGLVSTSQGGRWTTVEVTSGERPLPRLRS